MTSSTKTLPESYTRTHEIDLAKNKGLALGLNIVGGILFFLSIVLLGLFVGRVRPELSNGTLSVRFTPSTVLGLLLLMAITMVVHEFIHGSFFWAFTRSRPVFALRPAYAYAAAPDWFIPIRRYWIVGLAPLVIVDLICLLLVPCIPAGGILPVVLLVALNTGGSIGDLYIVSQLLRLSPKRFARDSGDRISIFEPAAGQK